MHFSCEMDFARLKWISVAFSVSFVILAVSDLAVTISWLVDGVDMGRSGLSFHVFLEALVALGMFLGVLGFAGCFGVLNESYRTVAISAGLSVIMAFGFIAVTISSEVLMERAAVHVLVEMDRNLQLVADDNSSEWYWANIQSSYNCCGIFGPDDWDIWSPLGGAPLSCLVTNGTSGNGTSDAYHQAGCYSKSIQSARKAITGCAVCTGTIAVILFIASIFLAMFSRRLKWLSRWRRKTEPEDDFNSPLAF